MIEILTKMTTINEKIGEVVIDIAKVSNPKLRVVVQERSRNFIFNYGDDERRYNEYNDCDRYEERYDNYSNHTQYTEYHEYDEYDNYFDTGWTRPRWEG